MRNLSIRGSDAGYYKKCSDESTLVHLIPINFPEEGCQGAAFVDATFEHRTRHVLFDRVRADCEQVGNLLVGVALYHKPDDVAFSSTQ